MSTSLGGNANICISCYNAEGATLLKGHAVALLGSADATFGLNNNTLDNVMIQVEKYDAGNTKFFGVPIHDIPAGKAGDICIFGLCQVATATGSGVVQNEKIQFDTAAAQAADWAAGAEHGIAIEPDGATQGDLFWAIINVMAGNDNDAAPPVGGGGFGGV